MGEGVGFAQPSSYFTMTRAIQSLQLALLVTVLVLAALTTEWVWQLRNRRDGPAGPSYHDYVPNKRILYDSVASDGVQGSWSPVLSSPPALDLSGNPALPNIGWLLPDGSLLVQTFGTTNGSNQWWTYSPDAFGAYESGAWNQVDNYPDYLGKPFSPAGQASALLPNGKMIFAGGENNLAADGSDLGLIETAMVTIYDVVAGAWTVTNGPSFCDISPHIDGLFDIPGFERDPASAFPPAPYVGDAASVVLETGEFMIGCSLSDKSALFDYELQQWRPVGRHKTGTNHEEGWVLLPSGKVLTVNLHVGDPDTPPPSQIVDTDVYDPATEAWSRGADLVFPITENIYITSGGGLTGSGPYSYPDREMGPSVLRPDNTVVWFGGASTGRNAIYLVAEDRWIEGPTFPYVDGVGQLSMPDTPAALLPNGNILALANPYFEPIGGQVPCLAFELRLSDNKFVQQPPVVDSAEVACYNFLLALPTGQVMAFDSTGVMQLYTPGDMSYDPAWAPVIVDHPKRVSGGLSYTLSGIRLNGMSQGAMFGDDFQQPTNWPLVQVVNDATGHVFYCRTYDYSFMGVQSDRLVTTSFDVPPSVESGASTLVVIVNGIPSEAKRISVM